MKLVSPLSFYRVWCLDDFSSQFGLAKLIAVIEKYWFQGLLKLILVGSFFWGSLRRRAQQIIVPEFANHLAGERAATWHALGGTRALWHHDSTLFFAIQRKIAFIWISLGLGWRSNRKAFVAISFFHVLNLRFAFWLPAGSHSCSPKKSSSQRAKCHSITAAYYQPACHNQLVTQGALGKIWVSFGYRFGYRSARAQLTCSRDWMNSLLRSTIARAGSNTRYCMELSIQHARTTCE